MCAGTEFGRGRTSHGPNTVVGARFSAAGAQGEEHHCMALLRVVWQGFWHFERFEGQAEASVLELTTRVWHSTTARAAESQATLTVQSARNKRIPQFVRHSRFNPQRSGCCSWHVEKVRSSPRALLEER